MKVMINNLINSNTLNGENLFNLRVVRRGFGAQAQNQAAVVLAEVHNRCQILIENHLKMVIANSASLRWPALVKPKVENYFLVLTLP